MDNNTVLVSMRTTEFQRVLDQTGRLELPPGSPGDPPVEGPPLFLSSDMTVTAQPGKRAYINGHYMGTPFIPGWRRGLIPDSWYTPQGFRSNSQSFVFGRGSQWDLGPQGGGWPTVTKILVNFVGICHESGGWPDMPLCGMQDPHKGYAVNPAPWQMFILHGWVTFALKTTDGQVRRWKVWFNRSQPTLEAMFEVDLVTGACRVQVNGVTTGVDAGEAGTDFAPDLRLVPNSFAPFGIFRMPPAGNDFGHLWAEGEVPDCTINALQVATNGTELCRLYATDPRPRSYSQEEDPNGEKSLPLLIGLTTHGGFYLRVVRTDQGNNDVERNILLRNLNISGRPWNPVIDMGAIMGGSGLVLDNCNIHNGSRSLQTSGLFVTYPVVVKGGASDHQSDCCFYLHRASGLTIDLHQMSYPGRAAAEFCGSFGMVKGPLMMAPGPPMQASFVQRGGFMTYFDLCQNYEYWPGYEYAFLRLIPSTYDMGHFETTARIRDCMAGEFTVPEAERTRYGPGRHAPLVDIYPRAYLSQPGYTASVIVDANQMLPTTRRVRVAPGVLLPDRPDSLQLRGVFADTTPLTVPRYLNDRRTQ